MGESVHNLNSFTVEQITKHFERKKDNEIAAIQNRRG